MCAVLLACGSESSTPKTTLPDVFTVFPNLPLPPGGQVISRSGSSDALQIRMFSPEPTDLVTKYYRDVLSKGKWRLIGDIKKSDGLVTLYAEQDGPPIWVRIWPTSDGAGTMVELAGAVTTKDSTRTGEAGSKAVSKTRS